MKILFKSNLDRQRYKASKNKDQHTVLHVPYSDHTTGIIIMTTCQKTGAWDRTPNPPVCTGIVYGCSSCCSSCYFCYLFLWTRWTQQEDCYSGRFIWCHDSSGPVHGNGQHTKNERTQFVQTLDKTCTLMANAIRPFHTVLASLCILSPKQVEALIPGVLCLWSAVTCDKLENNQNGTFQYSTQTWVRHDRHIQLPPWISTGWCEWVRCHMQKNGCVGPYTKSSCLHR